MSHIYKLLYNNHKNAINAANKTVEAGHGDARKTLCYSQKSYAVKQHSQTVFYRYGAQQSLAPSALYT